MPHLEKFAYSEKASSPAGSQPLRSVLSDVLVSASSLLGNNLYDRLRGILAEKGIEVDETPAT